MTYKKGHKPTRFGKGKNAQWLSDRVEHAGDECLIWPFGRRDNGYGALGYKGQLIHAHRLMCIFAHGPAPSAKHVAAHSCHNGHGGCVNPRHLSWKTYSENTLERRQAGTLTRKRWTNKGTLTDAQVAQIVALKGQKSQRAIAAMFGISYQHVSVIHQGKLKRQRAA